MTGYLHRLAQRANGTARLVRASPLTPSGLPPRPVEAMEPAQMQDGMVDQAAQGPTGETAPAPAMARTSMPGATFPSTHPRNHAAKDEQRPAANTQGTLAEQITPTPWMRPRPAAQHALDGAAPDTTGLAPASGQAAAPPKPRQAHDLANADPNLGQGQDPDADPTQDDGPALQGDANTPEQRGSHRGLQPQANLAGSVKPLLAAIAQVRMRGAYATRAASPGPSASRMVEETAEVHVSIGRIEVTALQGAPAPKKAPRNNRAPLSLDDYLSRRRGQTP
jgi:hypothetical protein